MVGSNPTNELQRVSSKMEDGHTMEEEEEGVTLTLNVPSTKEADFFHNLTEGTTQETTSTVAETTENEVKCWQTELPATLESSSLQPNPVTNNVILTTSEIHIDLPIYFPNSSETPESFLKFYTSEMHTVIIDDEATDLTVPDDYKRMSADDFVVVTEFPLTTEAGSNHSWTASEAQSKASALPPQVEEKPSDAGLIIPEELQRNYVPNACTASDYQNANGCFCVVDELLRRLNHAMRDKDLPNKVDSFHCLSFFKVKEGLLISNETVENRVKRSYLFLKQQQQELGMVKRETVPYSEIEHVLKVTTNIQCTGKCQQVEIGIYA